MDDVTETTLYYAIEKNEPDSLLKLLEEGLNPNVIFNGFDPLGKPLFWTPLHFCCEKGRYECAKLLLEFGADPDAGDRWCMTPLMYAIRTEWHNMVELMIGVKASVDLQDTRGRTPLHIATECSDDVCVKLLCDAKADVNIQDLVGRTPLWVTVTQDGRKSHLQRLLEKSDVNIPDKRDKRIALQEAIVYSNVDCLDYVRLLLKAGSNVNHRDEANLNSMLNLLMKIKRKGMSISSEEMEIAKLIIDSKYRLNDIPKRTSWHKFGGTALKMASEQGATGLVSLFLENGADPDLPDDCGVTPLLASVSNDHEATTLALLRSNCRMDIPGEMKLSIFKSSTPSSYSSSSHPSYSSSSAAARASSLSSSVLSPALLSSSLSSPTPQTIVVTPLQCAIRRGNFRTCRMLLQFGANFSPVDASYLLLGHKALDNDDRTTDNDTEHHNHNQHDNRANHVTAIPESLVNNCMLWSYLVYKVSNPPALFELCIFKVRRKLGRNLIDSLDLLPLPAFLKSSLLLKFVGVDEDDEFYGNDADDVGHVTRL